jgi:hypothetical protein
MRRGFIIIALVMPLLPAGAHAQSIEGSLGTFAVQSHAWFASTRLEQTGQWVEADAAATLGRLRAGISTTMGSLSGSAGAVHPDRSGRSTSLTLHGLAKPWAAIGVIAEAKRFESDAGTAVWRLIGGNLRLTPPLDSSALAGLVDISVWPASSVIGGQKMPVALRAVIGATYRIANGPVAIRMAYRFERFDFETDPSGARLEQFRGATIGAVLRLAR